MDKDKDKTNKPTQQIPKNQGNVNYHMTHNFGTLFPITNQHSMIHHKPTPSLDLYPSSSISTASNKIDIKDKPQIYFRK